MMHSKHYATLVLAVGVLFVAASLPLAAERMAAQPGGPLPAAEIVSVEGATTTFQVRDYDGRVVEVAVPSRSFTDVRTSGTTQESISGPTAQPEKTVHATVEEIDKQKNTVRVRTQTNQTLVLGLPAETLVGMQVGEKLSLVVPR
jgi:hypothetical protein